MQFTIQTEYGVDSPNEIKDDLIVANYRACEMVLMNTVLFPKADLEYIQAHYDFLSVLSVERGLDGKIAELDLEQLEQDEASERRFMA